MENIQYNEGFVISNFDGKIFLNDKQIHCGAVVDVYDEDANKWIDGKVYYSDGYQVNVDNMKTLKLIEGMRMRRKYKMSLL